MLVVSAIVVLVYLALTGLVVFSGLGYVAHNPAIWQDWLGRVLHADGVRRAGLPGMSLPGAGWAWRCGAFRRWRWG